VFLNHKHDGCQKKNLLPYILKNVTMDICTDRGYTHQQFTEFIIISL